MSMKASRMRCSALPSLLVATVTTLPPFASTVNSVTNTLYDAQQTLADLRVGVRNISDLVGSDSEDESIGNRLISRFLKTTERNPDDRDAHSAKIMGTGRQLVLRAKRKPGLRGRFDGEMENCCLEQ
jgi:hypothetical protein